MCNAMTIAGTQCKNKSATKYCRIHADSSDIRVVELESELKKAQDEVAKQTKLAEVMTFKFEHKSNVLKHLESEYTTLLVQQEGMLAAHIDDLRDANEKADYFKNAFTKIEADFTECLDMLDEAKAERDYHKKGYMSMMSTNGSRSAKIREVTDECTSLKATIAKLEDELKLIRDQPTSPKSQARVTNVSYVVQQSPNAIKDLEKQVDRLESELRDASKEADRLKAGHERDQLIKFFQTMHDEYESKNVPFNKRPQFYHDVRKARNQVAHPSSE